MTELKDFVALVLKVEETLKNNAKMPAFKSKSKTLSINLFKMKKMHCNSLKMHCNS